MVSLIVLSVALVGSSITSSGMAWYRSINLPAWTPSGAIIGFVWAVIFFLLAASMIVVWNQEIPPKKRRSIVVAFGVNILLNVFWSFLFFSRHLIAAAAVESGLLCLSVFWLMSSIRPASRFAARLLWLYGLWTVFATYLTYVIWRLN